MKIISYTYLLFPAALLFPSLLSGQLYLNEICAANQSVLIDSNDDTPDWIEIYNAGSQTVNLENYYLSDAENNIRKWSFPSVTIAPEEYLLVLASGDDYYDGTEIHSSFKLAASGEKVTFSAPDGQIIQQIFTPPLASDISYARSADGSYFYAAVPTPGAANDTDSQIFRTPAPLFDREAAPFAAPFLLTLHCPSENCQIFYTLDGSNPGEDGILYTAPLSLSENTVVRVIARMPNALPSEVVSRNYFRDAPHDLPVIALSTDPDNLFSYENGIFVNGPDASAEYPYYGANYWKEFEFPVHVELLSGSFARLADFDVGAQAHGGRGTRTNAQKAVRLSAEHQYGDDKMNFKFFPERENTEFEHITLRNAGGDFGEAQCRDEFTARFFLREGLDVDVITYQPAAWYVNGQYWGIIALREKFDEDWIEQNYGVPTDEVDLLEEDTITIAGTREVFNADYEFIIQNDLSNDALFAEAARRFDTKNIADYWTAQTVVLNANWPHNNLKLWRERKPDAQWRYLLFDTDVAMARYAWTEKEVNMLADKLNSDRFVIHTDIFLRLLDNENYRHYFINRYADLLNTAFRPENWSRATNEMQTEINKEMQRHSDRWDDCSDCNSYTHWADTAMTVLHDFSCERPAVARRQVQDYFELSDQVLLDLRTYPAGAGSIRINTVTPDALPWDGYYFDGVPVELTVLPAPGFTFSHWQSLSGIPEPVSSPSVRVNFSEDDAITAYFTAEYTGLGGLINPNPATEAAAVSFTLDRISDTEISLYEADGKRVRRLYSRRLNAGTHTVDINSVSDLPSGVYYIRILTPTESQSLKFVVL